ncbi:MAG: RNA polymerase sigma factor [Bacteroidota bacterium]
MIDPNNHIETKNDLALIEAYKSLNDSEALGVLFQRYMHLVYGLCLKYLKSREESQDAVMSIFEQLTKKLKEQEVTYFKSWLYIVTKNHCLMTLRRKSNQKEFNGLIMENELILHPKDEYEIDGDLKALEECLKDLKGKQKECISLFYLKQKSYEEITISTSFSLKEVKSYIQNGKRNLKNCLEAKHVIR